MSDLKHPRKKIEDAIAAGNLHELLMISGMLHGHFCPFSALGVKGGVRAMKDLRANSTGMEEVIAIIETNNCFSDGVQITTGCSFGNNALIFRDYGKTAFTLAHRTGDGIRIAVKTDKVMEERSPEATALFEKVVTRRSGTDAERKKLNELWTEFSFHLLNIPDEKVFDVRGVKIDVPAYARIFSSVKCSVCSENIMEPRARMKDGKPICLACSDYEYYQLAGDGISVIGR